MFDNKDKLTETEGAFIKEEARRNGISQGSIVDWWTGVDDK